MFEFHEYQHEESHTFLMGVNEITFTDVPTFFSLSPLPPHLLFISRLRGGQNVSAVITIPVWAGYCSFQKQDISFSTFLLTNNHSGSVLGQDQD